MFGLSAVNRRSVVVFPVPVNNRHLSLNSIIPQNCTNVRSVFTSKCHNFDDFSWLKSVVDNLRLLCSQLSTRALTREKKEERKGKSKRQSFSISIDLQRPLWRNLTF